MGHWFTVFAPSSSHVAYYIHSGLRLHLPIWCLRYGMCFSVMPTHVGGCRPGETEAGGPQAKAACTFTCTRKHICMHKSHNPIVHPKHTCKSQRTKKQFSLSSYCSKADSQHGMGFLGDSHLLDFSSLSATFLLKNLLIIEDSSW